MPKKPKPHEMRDRSFRVKCGAERASVPRMVLPERHLFVTEGAETEPNYLNGLVDVICKNYGEAARRQFKIIGEGNNTLYLLQRAEAYQQNEGDEYQHIWIIYDKDDFPACDFDNTVKRCEAINKRFKAEGREIQYHAIWSNQCIELWFLLHFNYLDTDIDRAQYRAILSDELGRHYEKNDEEILGTLLPRTDRAIQNAKKLMEKYDEGEPPSQKAPGTNFYELVEYLKGYLTPAK
ncbi:MAG: RloB family protein [Oscillospiraceae bacterium]|nr:RloB family protein [Oscillospiraceae bacterium]MDE7171950.1 RloB family protein [Oscillospiraceae bacterium]